MLTKLLITGVAYAVLLLLLSKTKNFSIRPGGLFIVTIVLLLVDYVLGTILGFVAWLPKILTLGLLNPVINWVINVIVFWTTDKLTDSLEIKSLPMLLGSGLALSLASYAVSFVLR